MSTTSAGSLGVVVEADTASFESSMSKVGAAAEREFARAQAASAKAKAEGDRFVAMLQKQADTFGLTGTALLAYEARLKGVSAQADPLIAKINAMAAAQKAANDAAKAGGASNGFKDTADGADKAAHGTAGLTRELVVLGHEASQGNFRRFGGSLLVLAEYSATAQKALSALIGPVGLVIAAAGIFALAAHKGAEEADELRNSMKLTGDFAGITAGQFEKLAKSIAAGTGSSIGKATDALQALVATGEVGPQALGAMAEATIKLEALTGKSAEEIAKDFAKMQEGPTKWAAEANKSYNFLTAAQYDQIKSTDDLGQHQEAAMLVMDRLNDHLGKTLPESLTGLGRALHDASLWWDEFWHSAVHAGAPETVDDKLDAAKKRLAELQHPGNGRGTVDLSENLGRGVTVGSQIAQAQKDVADLEAKAAAEKKLTAATAERQRVDKLGTTASQTLADIDKLAKGTDKYRLDIEALTAAEKARAAARIADGQSPVQPGDAAQHARDVAYYQRTDRTIGDKAANRGAKEYSSLIASIDAYNDKVTQEVATQGKLSQSQEFAIEQHKRLEEASRTLTKAQQDSLQSAAQAAEVRGAMAERAKDFMTLAESIQQYNKETAIALGQQKALSEPQKWAADQHKRVNDDPSLSADDRSAFGMSIDASASSRDLSDRVDAIKKYADGVMDAETEQRALLGATADQVDAIKKLQGYDNVLGRAMFGASGDVAKKLDDFAATLRGKVVDSINATKKAQDDASSSFSAGWDKAMQDYAKKANDNAAFGAKVFNDSTSSMSDAITKFAETGTLSFKTFFKTLADDIIRFEVNNGVSSAFSSGTGFVESLFSGGGAGVLGTLSSALGFGGGASSGGSVDTYAEDWGSAFEGTPLASGIDRVPYNGFPAILHEDETVLNRYDAAAYRDSSSGGGSPNFDFRGQTINVGQGVSRSEVSAAVAQGNAQVVAHINRQVKTGRLAA